MTDISDPNDWLQQTCIFRGLSPDKLKSVTQIAQWQRFPKGEMIFQQGDEATGFYVIKTGRVKVFKLSVNGKEQILNIFGSGDEFAEVPALDGKCFPASAATLETSELLFFPRIAFIHLLYQSPDIAINMLISFSQHLRHFAGLIEDLSFKDVHQRLAAYILNLTQSHSHSNHAFDHSNKIVILDLTKSQLASSLGTIPATLSRAFYRLSSEGMIAMNDAQIEILDCDRLQKLSQFLE
ncbi:MAG: transcriptional regulator [Pseudanabaena frigida]|uniref:Transcriptional regulator n=1 Tax=Pseudanabaena frigida TaxID=945775 RepID=A0A2W4VVE1_9CYAN|nr:MAG: transcriptional regulator [Pseudanabaena frigida]